MHQDHLAQRYGSLTDRDYPLRFNYRWLQNTQTSYVLPDGYHPVSLPEPQEWNLTTASGSPLASMFVVYDFADGVLTVTDELRIDCEEVSVEDYPDFRSFLAAYEHIQAQVVSFRTGE